MFEFTIQKDLFNFIRTHHLSKMINELCQPIRTESLDDNCGIYLLCIFPISWPATGGAPVY